MIDKKYSENISSIFIRTLRGVKTEDNAFKGKSRAYRYVGNVSSQ